MPHASNIIPCHVMLDGTSVKVLAIRIPYW